MRPLSRIDIFLDELNRVWKTAIPDWRFGQFLYNFMKWEFSVHGDFFFLEENEMMEHIHEFIKGINHNWK